MGDADNIPPVSVAAPTESPTVAVGAVYESRPTNRRTRSEMDDIRAAITKILGEIQPATVRQVYYQLVGRGVIAKTEAEYKSTVVRLLTAMRRAKEIPFGWIADNTRWMRKPS